MSTLQVRTELPFEELLSAIENLPLPDLDKLVSQAITLQARHRAPSLPEKEADLLLQINQGLPENLNDKYNKLIEKRRAENLTENEYKELLLLGDKVEKIEATRVKNLAKLANLRQVDITDLMTSLDIPAPTYV